MLEIIKKKFLKSIWTFKYPWVVGRHLGIEPLGWREIPTQTLVPSFSLPNKDPILGMRPKFSQKFWLQNEPPPATRHPLLDRQEEKT